MAFTARLCNPTPFDVDLPWDRGVSIQIPAFGDAALSLQQLDDFSPGKPGSATVREVLNYHGLFLLDADRPYDHQAFEAIGRSHGAKKSQYDATIRNIIDRRAAAGVTPNDEALKETLTQMGYTELGRKIEVLKEQMAKYGKVVKESPESAQRAQLDPKRTVFILNPPRMFPSVAAMEFFLEQNPDIAAKHRALNMSATHAPVASSAPSFADTTVDRTAVGERREAPEGF